MHDADPKLIAVATAKGTELLRTGVVDLNRWSRVMRHTYGEILDPHLNTIWQTCQQQTAVAPECEAQPQPTELFNELTALRDETRSSMPELCRKAASFLGAQIGNVLLAVIAALLFLIWQRMPPTIGDYATTKDQRALYLKQPLIRAEIPGVVDVTVQNEPIEVKGGVTLNDSPLDVRIVR
ncbi:MAG TPA: hypothetical protein VMZ30_21835 [Pyrinomonadaceae bacterium]|nr:hypothetical protein [Pyrinomonadaceae bacterium]